MSEFGKRIRLNRILAQPGRGALVVAFDHALVLGPIPGTEDPCGKIRRFAAAGADGILLNLGLIKNCIHSFPRGATPGLIARLDWTTVWNTPAPRESADLRSCLVAHPEEAMRHGADAVLTYLVIGSGDAEFESREIARNAQVARECERIGMPLMVETLARGRNVENPGDPKWLVQHTRIAVELGADVIKTDYAGDADAMRQVVEGCPLPILVLGGSRNQSALDVVRGVAQSGAAGVFFGRNVFQSDDMEGFLRQARAILNGEDTPSAGA